MGEGFFEPDLAFFWGFPATMTVFLGMARKSLAAKLGRAMTDPRAWTPALLLLASLAACRGAEPGQEGPTLVPTGDLVETVEPPSDDRSVELDLEQLIVDSRLENGLRVVDLQLRNRSGGEISFAYLVEWMDRRGEPVPDREARWRHLVLPAEASAPLSLQAPSPRAESWRLRAAAAPR